MFCFKVELEGAIMSFQCKFSHIFLQYLLIGLPTQRPAPLHPVESPWFGQCDFLLEILHNIHMVFRRNSEFLNIAYILFNGMNVVLD